MSDELIICGTPFPSIENDNKNYVPVWKQKAVSSKGHKRFHGAFEGGFSAGYFNTAGSKEGWKPSEFISSRSNLEKSGDRAEHFMDEEDMTELNSKNIVSVGIKHQIKLNILKGNDNDPLIIISKYLEKVDSGPNLNLRSNPKNCEAFSGGAWDEEDDTLNIHENDISLSLHKLYATVESFENCTENALEISFRHPTIIEGDAKYEISNIPDNFMPKKIEGISGSEFKLKQYFPPITDLNLDSSLDQPLGDIDEKTASAALKGFMPFAEDPDKQSRYVKYLRFCHDKSGKVDIPKSMLYIDEREREEFVMSAQIFKPPSSIISSRFESSTMTLQSQIQLKPGLTRPDITKKLSCTYEATSPKTHKEETPEHSKKINIDLGRVSYVWTPNSLLCKRFNVSPPDLGVADTIESKPVNPVLADELVEQLMSNFRKVSKSNVQFDSSEKSRNIHEECDPSLPSDDLFDEIFGSGDLTTKPTPHRAKASNYFGED